MIFMIWTNGTPLNNIIPIHSCGCINSGLRKFNKRKTTHSHIFLPKYYSGDPYASIFTPYTEAEVLSFLETGWGIGNVSDLRLSFLSGPLDDQ